MDITWEVLILDKFIEVSDEQPLNIPDKILISDVLKWDKSISTILLQLLNIQPVALRWHYAEYY